MAKLAFDQVIDPSIKPAEITAELDKMARTASDMAGPGAPEGRKLAALQKLIYVAGPWNDNRPFSYDLADPNGQDIRHKLLSNYLQSRRGNCVSMPILFLLLADRMGLNGAALADAPLHLFIRYTNVAGRQFNLETTSGANVARDVWMRQQAPMTDKAIENGLYLRPLTRREAVANMAETIVEYLIDAGRYEDAIAVSEVILKNYPRDVFMMVKEGTAYGDLLNAEFITKYPTPDLIPPAMRPRYEMLTAKNEALFAAAEALGWQADQ